jgi:hypothetical protein
MRLQEAAGASLRGLVGANESKSIAMQLPCLAVPTFSFRQYPNINLSLSVTDPNGKRK